MLFRCFQLRGKQMRTDTHTHQRGAECDPVTCADRSVHKETVNTHTKTAINTPANSNNNNNRILKSTNEADVLHHLSQVALLKTIINSRGFLGLFVFYTKLFTKHGNRAQNR